MNISNITPQNKIVFIEGVHTPMSNPEMLKRLQMNSDGKGNGLRDAHVLYKRRHTISIHNRVN